MSIQDAASRYCSPIQERVVIVPADRPVICSEIKQGIVFVWALWSRPAVVALETLVAELSSIPEFKGITVYLLDNDAATTEQFLTSIEVTPGGKGETFWISDGKVIAGLSDYTPRDGDVLVQYTRKLLSS